MKTTNAALAAAGIRRRPRLTGAAPCGARAIATGAAASRSGPSPPRARPRAACASDSAPGASTASVSTYQP